MLLPTIPAHFLQLINLEGNNLPSRHQLYKETLFPGGRLHSVTFFMRTNLLAMVCLRSTAALCLLNLQNRNSLLGSREELADHYVAAECGKYSSFCQPSRACSGRREEGKKKDKDTNPHPGAVRGERWRVQLPGMMFLSSGSQWLTSLCSSIEFGQDLWVLVPSIPCSCLHILSTSPVHSHQRKTPLKCQGSLQDSCFGILNQLQS